MGKTAGRMPNKNRTKIYVKAYGDLYYLVKLPVMQVQRILNGQESWQSEDFTFTEVERVYATRYDCMAEPEGVRQLAVAISSKSEDCKKEKYQKHSELHFPRIPDHLKQSGLFGLAPSVAALL